MLTMKIFDGVYAHKEIVEGGKDQKDFASYLRLGKTLLIGEETFEDLDEVIDRYVDPLISNLKAILDYRKFRRGTKQHINDLSQQDSLPPIRSVVAMVPMKSPGPGGSAGGAGYIGSGWVGSATNRGGGRVDGWGWLAVGWSAVDGSKGRDGGWRGSVTNSGGGRDDGWGRSAVDGGKGRDGGRRGSSRDFRCF